MIYLDASVVFSLHFRDSNTDEALNLVSGATDALVVSALCEMETVNAFALRVFRHEMSERNMGKAVKDLESDLRSGVLQWKPIPEAAFTRAKALSRKITPSVGVRAVDLLHIAAAFELGVKSLYTLDLKQHQAAQAAGLRVNQLPSPHARP
ncbi:MAG TPA: type II toxin-antitoxin system VapC family toxin [Terracidiphilus sp.]|jgi:predicted nucleic acid-binding protein|nr:type II toxin-antitoxin system VapC family toxin [Terracidiphilus sp.]